MPRACRCDTCPELQAVSPWRARGPNGMRGTAGSVHRLFLQLTKLPYLPLWKIINRLGLSSQGALIGPVAIQDCFPDAR